MAVQAKCLIKCPECGFESEEKMPLDGCQWLYECEHCRTVLKALPDKHCVFCSYGNVPCTTMQLHEGVDLARQTDAEVEL